MNLTLSTDDPLQFHLTREPLIEEYAIAAQVWRLTQVDLCEIARNSIIMSGFKRETKEEWLGKGFDSIHPKDNEPNKSNVPSIRIAFRAEVLQQQLKRLLNISS